MTAMEAFHVSNFPNLDNASVSAAPFSAGMTTMFKIEKFLVVGHRGQGMNQLQSSDRRMRAIKENSIMSFNAAAKFAVDFIEFDVQVTKDNCPVIFHDNFILSEESGTICEKRVTDLSLLEFLSYGPQKDAIKVSKNLLRKTKDGEVVKWDVEFDDSLCTLQQAFQNVEPSLGFNIELKFDDHLVYEQQDLLRPLQATLQVVKKHAKDRPVIFSSFHPDAALLIRKLQNSYPVFFLTEGGTELYCDIRRNSLEEAVKICLEGGLQGIVSEVQGVFRNPGAVTKIKQSNLSLLTYGKLKTEGVLCTVIWTVTWALFHLKLVSNVAQSVYLQHQMGIEGVIVDLVQEISQKVSQMTNKLHPPEPQFSKNELSFLFKLVPESMHC